MDYSKAVDKVWHRLLLHKLERYGIKGNIFDWIKSFLYETMQKVAINGISSEPLPVLSGVPQGGVLGPILFLVYINDLLEMLSCTKMLFADDTNYILEKYISARPSKSSTIH